MKNIALLILGLSLVGCSKEQPAESNAGSKIKSTSEPITVYVGIYNDGSGTWDWGGILSHNTQCNGTLDWPTPMIMKGTFGPTNCANAAIFNLSIDVDSETNYIVKGTADIKQPTTLVLLGTGETQSTDKQIALSIGHNDINFKGKLLATFQKK